MAIKQTLTSAYGTGLTSKQKKAVNFTYTDPLIFGSTEEGRSIEKAVLGGADADNATALSLNHTVSQVTTASSKTHVSLADGVLGQVKIITHFGKVGDHDLVITPVNFANGTNITSDTLRRTITLMYDGNNWQVIAGEITGTAEMVVG
mgnify:FL=1|tara:strand:- start:40 stop:483 length:444 start_codon:yes stop_codon:yes gene_type:complete